MAVDIPISANASGVVNAMRQIETAIARAKGVAVDFSAIDLSHSEVGKLTADIATMTKNLEDLMRVGRGSTSMGVKAILGPAGVGGDLPNALQTWAEGVEKRYPDPIGRRRHVQTVLDYIARGTSGTSLASPSPGDDDDDQGGSGGAPAPAGPAVPKPGRGRSEGFFRSGGRAVGSSLGSIFAGEAGAGAFGGAGAALGGLLPEIGLPLLAIAGISSVGKMVGKGFQGAVDEDKADDSLIRAVQGSTSDFNSLRDAARQAAAGLMITYQQSAELGKNFAQIANITDPHQAFSGMRAAVGFGNAIGIDAGTATSSFASATLMGMDPARFADLIEEAANKGNMTSQTPQVLSAILSFAQNASRSLVTGGAIWGASRNYASMYASLNATNDPGLHGANAEALLGSINSAVMGGGNAGMPGQVLTYQALARAGITDPFMQQMDLAGGAFAPLLSTQKGVDDVYDALRVNVFSKITNPTQRAYAESMYFAGNTSQMHQWASIDKLKSADLDQTAAYLSSIGISPDKQNLAALPDITNFLAGRLSPAQVKAQLYATGTLSDADHSAIENAQTPDDLKKALIEGLNDQGIGQDDATKLQQAQVDSSNKLEASMSALVPVVTTMDKTLSALLTPMQNISADLDIFFKKVGPSSVPTGTSIVASESGGMSPQSFFQKNISPVTSQNPGGATRGQRNYNPLDLMYVPGQPIAWGWDTSKDGMHMGIYGSVDAGLAGAARQLQMYIARGDKTLTQVDADYSGNDPAANPNEAALLKQIEKVTGLSANSDLSDPKNMAAYMAAKAMAESGSVVTPAQALAAIKTSGIMTVYVKYPDGKTAKQTAPVTHVGTPQPNNKATAPAKPGSQNTAPSPSNVMTSTP